MNKKQIFFAFTTLILIYVMFERLKSAAVSAAYKALNADYKTKFFIPTYPNLSLRYHDSYGSGNFGASRDGGKRKHKGQDYLVASGSTIFAPISGTLTSGPAYASGKNPELRLIKIKSGLTTVNLMYVKPESDLIGKTVEKGQPIGTAQSLQKLYPGIPNHIHVEILLAGVNVDPVPYFKPIIV